MITAPVLHNFLLSFSAYGSSVATIVPWLHYAGIMAYGPWLALLGVGCVSATALYYLCTQPLQATSMVTIFTDKELAIDFPQDMQLNTSSGANLTKEESKAIIEHRKRNIKEKIELYRTWYEKHLFGRVGLFILGCLSTIWYRIEPVLIWVLFKNFIYFMHLILLLMLKKGDIAAKREG